MIVIEILGKITGLIFVEIIFKEIIFETYKLFKKTINFIGIKIFGFGAKSLKLKKHLRKNYFIKISNKLKA